MCIRDRYGSYEEKFAGLRALYGFTYAHPGKKLLFMGGEFAQFVEWRDKQQLDWFLIDDFEMHHSFHEYVAKLNDLYKNEPALYELDMSPEGFEWCLQRDADHSVVAFIRKGRKKRGKKQEQILCVCNFTPMEWDNYEIPMPAKAKLTKILDSSELDFGGDGDVSEDKARTKRVRAVGEDGKGYYHNAAHISLKALSVVYYKVEEIEEKPRKTAKRKTTAKKTTAKKTEEKKTAAAVKKETEAKTTAAAKKTEEKKTAAAEKADKKPVQAKKKTSEPVKETKKAVQPAQAKETVKKTEDKKPAKNTAPEKDTKDKEPVKVESKVKEAKKPAAAVKKETEKKAAADTTALKQEKTAAKAAIKKQPENSTKEEKEKGEKKETTTQKNKK